MGPVGRAELRDERLAGLLYGVLGQHHGPGDLLVRVALGEVLEELELPGAQGVLRRGRRTFRPRAVATDFRRVVEPARERPGDGLLDQVHGVVRLGECRRLLWTERRQAG